MLIITQKLKNSVGVVSEVLETEWNPIFSNHTIIRTRLLFPFRQSTTVRNCIRSMDLRTEVRSH